MGFLFAGNPIMEQGRFEPNEVTLIQSLLPDSDVFVNIGANIGFYVCLALDAGKSAIAVEPNTANLRCLYRNLGANGWLRDVEIYPIALADEIGIEPMFGSGITSSLVPGWAHSSGRVTEFVPVSTLDRILGSRLQGKRALFLVDVEGAELRLLKGAKKQLSLLPRPVWIVEISVTEHLPSGTKLNPNMLETFETFFQCGYAARTANIPGRLISMDEIQKVAATGQNTLVTHNILFFDAEDPTLRPR